MLSRNVVRRLRAAGRATAIVSKPHRPLQSDSLASFRRELATVAPTTTAAKEPSPNDIFANGTNAYYAEEMYRRWREDPKSVHASWDVYFSGLEKGLPSQFAFQPPPQHIPNPADGAPVLHASGSAELDDHLKVCVPAYVIVFIAFSSVLIAVCPMPCVCLIGPTSCPCISSPGSPPC